MSPPADDLRWTARACTWALRSYLCLVLTGCGAHRPPVSQSAATSSETYVLQSDERTAFRSCDAALREAGFTVDLADPNEGVFHGHLTTQERIGVIVDGSGERPMSGWQVGMLVLTGAALLVGGALSLADELKGEDATARGVGAALAILDVATSIEIPPPIVHEYEIAIQLVPMEGSTTQVRVLLDGTERRGKEVRTGRVDAPDYLKRFYSALDRSAQSEQERQALHILSGQ